MTDSTRIYGKQLSLEVDGDDYFGDITNCVKKAELDGDTVVTFKNANDGDIYKHYFEVTAIQSTDATSFWTFCDEHVGETFPFTYAVHGNATPSASQPHLIGTLEIVAPPDLGGEAGRKKTQTFSMRLDIIGTPVKDITP